MNSETHPYTLGGKGELPYEYGANLNLNSLLVKRQIDNPSPASSLLKFCLWGELSSGYRASCLRGELSLGRVVIQIYVCNSFGRGMTKRRNQLDFAKSTF